MSVCITDLLKLSSARHSHLCPRQVLGVRMGLAGMAAIGLELGLTKHNGLIVVETDGCFADGVEVATGATIGHRTLRVNDLGKIAATFANVKTGLTIRLSPASDVRVRSRNYAPDEERHYFAQVQGYQLMPEKELFIFEQVILYPSLGDLIAEPNARAICQNCREEIINDRQVMMGGFILCRTCADQGYYQVIRSSRKLNQLPDGALKALEPI